MELSHTTEQILLYIIYIIFFVCIVFILRDIYHIFKIKKEKKNMTKLSFEHYKTLKNAALNDYIFYAPYGVSQSLFIFVSEAPSFISAVEGINRLDYPLTKSYQNEHDPNMKEVYINIAIQLSNIISNSGRILIKHCNFYCENVSNSFQLQCDANLIQNYCKLAMEIHNIDSMVKKKSIESPEIVSMLSIMYQEFVDYFERINSLITFIPNEKGETHNDK